MNLNWSEYDENGVSEVQVHPAIMGLVCRTGPKWRYSAGWSQDDVVGEATNEAQAKEMVARHLSSCSVPPFITEAVAGPHLDFNISFDNIKQKVPGTAQSVEVMKSVIEDGCGFVTLVDVPGSGKTHMLGTALHSLCRDYLLSGNPMPVTDHIRFGYMAAMIDGLRALYSSNDFGRTFNDAWQQLIDIPALLIDDIDKAPRSDWSRARMYELIDRRYRARHAFVTIMAANSLNDLPQPIRSRIEDGSCYLTNLGGKSQRRQRQSREAAWKS